MTRALLVFIFYFFTDLLVVLYYRKVMLNSKWTAAILSAAITGMALIGIITPDLVLVAMSGAFFGTAWGMRG
jgi:hypothetical protein